MNINQPLFDKLLEEAVNCERKRVSRDLRNSADDQSQRTLNALVPGTYLPIHRHQDTSETILLLCGSLIVVLYDNNGAESARHELNPTKGEYGVHVPKGIWHTVIVSERCIIFEAKDGPHKPLTSDDVWNYE